MCRIRETLLFIFRLVYTDNDIEYNLGLSTLFNDKIPTKLRKCPNFSYDDKPLEEILKL